MYVAELLRDMLALVTLGSWFSKVLELSGMPYILNMFLVPEPKISYVWIIWGNFPRLFILD